MVRKGVASSGRRVSTGRVSNKKTWYSDWYRSGGFRDETNPAYNQKLKVVSHIVRNSLPKGACILDVGCGRGLIGALLSAYGYKLYGIDIVEELGRIVLERGYSGYIVHNIENGVPFPDESFDGVLALDIIEHIWDTDKFLDEIHRVLRPAGLLVITTPNLCFLGNLFLILLGYQLPSVEFRKSHEDAGHVNYYSPHALRLQLLQHGFINVTFHRCPVPPVCARPSVYPRWLQKPPVSWMITLLYRVATLTKRWGNMLVVSARKPAAKDS